MEDGFRASWGKAQKKVSVVVVSFNDLQGTAVTRLALVGSACHQRPGGLLVPPLTLSLVT
jgi:hypothetical protein